MNQPRGMASEIKVIYPGRVAIFHELLSERAWSQLLALYGGALV